MLAGHYAPALALKAVNPRVPLWVLFVGTQLVDIAWGVFVCAGIEKAHIQPGFTESNGLVLEWVVLSHSLVASFLWAAAAGLVAEVLLPRARAGITMAAAVISHWFLDLPMHVADLPLSGTHSTKLGFGLWQDRGLSCLAEAGVLALGAAWWLSTTQPQGTQRWVRGLIGGLMVLAVAAYYGPQPPTITETAVAGLVLYVSMPFLARAADRGRVA